MTAAEYLAGPVDKRNTELIHGEVVVSPKPSDDHRDIGHFVGEVLRRWARHFDLGKVSYDIDMVLDDAKDLVYAPDVLFVAKEHRTRRREGRLYGAADLCVEIASPNDKARPTGQVS
jgi:Uma2 family endonuclease